MVTDFGRKARPEDHPEPKPDIGLFARIFGRAGNRDPVERDGVAARAEHLLLGEAGIAEEAARELGGKMLGATRVERIGHETRIVGARKRDAVTRERHHVELGVLHDLEHALILEDRLQEIERLAQRDLRDGFAAAKIEPVARAVRERHIGRVTRHERERNASQLAAHRIG